MKSNARWLLLSVSAAILAVGALACKSDQKTALAPPEPGLEAKPRWLTFQCVRPGCETTLTATVTVLGTRPLAVKRVVLSDRERTDVTVSPSKAPPFVLKPGEPFPLEVRYAPNGDPRLGDLDVLVTYTDGELTESSDRVKAGELRIPIVRRLIGEPQLSVDPPVLAFGAVLPGTRRTLPLRVLNSGFGNVGVVVDSVTSDLPEVSVARLPTAAILPGDAWALEVTFAPVEEAFTAGFITVRSADPEAPPAMVAVIGTSIPHAELLLTPEGGVDFGEVPRGTTAQAQVEITNQGAEPIRLTTVEIDGRPGRLPLSVVLPLGALGRPLGALETITATVTLQGRAAGPIEARLVVRGVDTATRTAELPITALVTEPNAEVSPAAVDFGGVPHGWTASRTVEITNSGYGDLVLTNVAFAGGSSQLFTLTNLQFPVRLLHDQRASVGIEFRAETEAAFMGLLVIDTNDPDRPNIEVPVSAAGVSCEAGCPIAHGQPTCLSGMCAVASCDPGFYDTDQDPMNGCECAEVGRDPGAFCTEAHDLGTVADSGARTNYSGVISGVGDEDLIRFFGLDESQFFTDDYDVRVSFQSGDPNLEMCVYRHDTGSHDSACFFDGESCGSSYRKEGSWPGDDGADFIIKVRRRAGAPAACSSYTVFVSNG